MKKNILWQITGAVFILILSGCAVRTYTVVKDRVDQDLTAGNKGYLMGTTPQTMETKERKATRTTYVTEIELPALTKLGHKSKTAVTPAAAESAKTGQSAGENFEKYKVINGDTLEKISKRFYGTTKKWVKIYEANKDKLRAPNKIYPGQIIDIPVEGIKK